MTPSGEDTIIFCQKGHFSQNKEIAKVKEGDQCPICQGKLSSARAVEVANIFPLGDKYTKAFEVTYRDKDGKARPIIMGCYGIGIDRTLATAVEVNHDDRGIVWPEDISPFDFHLLPIEASFEVRKATEKIYADLEKQGAAVLYDDRDKSPGEKFADADLIGIAKRIVVSEKTLAQDSVEIKKRNENKVSLVKINSLIKLLEKK
jgi:prolyl-tRNA synthetase